MSNFVLELKILKPEAAHGYSAPLTYATDGSAGLDVRACLDAPVTVNPGDTYMVPTGIAIHIGDPNYVGLLFPRSGLSTKHGIVLANNVGVIDSDYQGQLIVPIWNRSFSSYTIKHGERLAQLVIVPVIRPKEIKIVDEFSNGETARGTGGFGHSGVL